MKVKLLTAIIGAILITVNTANADFPYPADDSQAPGSSSSATPSAQANSAAAQGDIVDSGGSLKIVPKSQQRKMIGPSAIQPNAPTSMPLGQVMPGQMQQGQPPQNQASGQMPPDLSSPDQSSGQIPQGQMPPDLSSPDQSSGQIPQGQMPQQMGVQPSPASGNMPMPGGAQ